MKNRILLACFLLAVSFVGLNAQTPEETDLDLKYAVDMLKPGTPAPDFILNDINGRQVRLGDFKGKTVVLQFWASWCPDCRNERLCNLCRLPHQLDTFAVSYRRGRQGCPRHSHDRQA